MRVLQDVKPTPEQLRIIQRITPGVVVIRGAAGSGKTTTALLRLRALTSFFVNRKRRSGREEPVRILVLTYNRTLRGYIAALAHNQAGNGEEYELEISTFGRWAMTALGNPPVVGRDPQKSEILRLGGALGLPRDFLVDEVEYVLGRFLPEHLAEYLNVERTGRGAMPRMDRTRRQRLLDEVIAPYEAWKDDRGEGDWNDIAVQLFRNRVPHPYDVIIADETQDFSANQIRALHAQLAEAYSLTFVLDATQRIYARGFTWQEAGITVRPEDSVRLVRNYRNTIEIARFAAPILEGLPIEDDGTIPDFSSCDRHGRVPIVLKGRFGEQTQFVIDYLEREVDLSEESVGIFHPRGGGAFRYIKNQFAARGLDFVEITRDPDWPEGDENIAFSTLHSAKGLEFDHVFVLGLNEEFTPHGDGEGDDRLAMLRRLLAMGIGRARNSVIVGYKPEEASVLIDHLDRATYQEIDLCP